MITGAATGPLITGFISDVYVSNDNYYGHFTIRISTHTIVTGVLYVRNFMDSLLYFGPV